MYTTKVEKDETVLVGEKRERGGDARIELATSCTLSKNHTTRPITQFYNDGVHTHTHTHTHTQHMN